MLFNQQQFERDHLALKNQLGAELQAFQAEGRQPDWLATVTERWAQFLVCGRGLNTLSTIARALQSIVAPLDPNHRIKVANDVALVIQDLYTAAGFLVGGVGIPIRFEDGAANLDDVIDKEATMRLYWKAALPAMRAAQEAADAAVKAREAAERGPSPESIVENFKRADDGALADDGA